MISSNLAEQMQSIIRKHGDAYRKDLPGLIAQMRGHIETIIAGASDEVLATLQREAHDMKGQAATFGMIDLSRVAESLSRILERNPAHGKPLTDMLHAHVTALASLLEKDDPELVEATVARAATLT